MVLPVGVLIALSPAGQEVRPGCLLSVSPPGMQCSHLLSSPLSHSGHLPRMPNAPLCPGTMLSLYESFSVCVCADTSIGLGESGHGLYLGGAVLESPSKLGPRLHCLLLSDPPPHPYSQPPAHFWVPWFSLQAFVGGTEVSL